MPSQRSVRIRSRPSNPTFGVANIDDDTTVVMADIPGLIEGAAEGAGLGHDFLRHIQRTRVLIHMIDGQSEDPLADYSQINTELSLFDTKLGKKPQIVVLNKIDQPDVLERLAEITASFKNKNIDLITASAMARTNTRDILVSAYKDRRNCPPKCWKRKHSPFTNLMWIRINLRLSTKKLAIGASPAWQLNAPPR